VYQSLFSSETENGDPNCGDIGVSARTEDVILYVMERVDEERARVEADTAQEMRAGIEELERAMERLEERVSKRKRELLARANEEEARKIRAVCAWGVSATPPPPS
jgi:uncharacterized protein with von Willebrand factor type A (vWA) domain